MNKCFSYLVAAALVPLSLTLAQGNLVPFSITISSATNIFKAGSEVRIRLVFTNTSAEDIPYRRGLGVGVEPQGELFSDVEVRDAKGARAPDTRYHRVIRGKDHAGVNPAAMEKSGPAPISPVRPEPRPTINMSVMTHMLKLGESREEDIVVSKLYDLTQPGQYTISASRRLSEVPTDPYGKLAAKSNTLTITITK